MEAHSHSLLKVLYRGLICILISSFLLSIFSVIIGLVDLEPVQGVVIIFPFIISTPGISDLFIWSVLIFISLLFLFWIGHKTFQRSKDSLIPISRQCPICATFLPIKSKYCIVCGEEYQSYTLTPNKIRRSL